MHDSLPGTNFYGFISTCEPAGTACDQIARNNKGAASTRHDGGMSHGPQKRRQAKLASTGHLGFRV